MKPELVEKINELLEEIPVTNYNKYQIEHIKELVEEDNFKEALTVIQELKNAPVEEEKKDDEDEEDDEEFKDAKLKENKKEKKENKAEDEEENKEKELEQDTYKYPKELINEKLEVAYIGLLLTDPRSISKYYFLYEDCYFEDDIILNLYKIVLFTDGEAYASGEAKAGFSFARNIEKIFPLKEDYKLRVKGRKYDFEKVYVELRKLFALRKGYSKNPIKNIQDKILEIRKYTLYDKMSIEEVENAVRQVEVTAKFKQSILNKGISEFITADSNTLSNGLALPFPILSKEFKGIRKGETSSFAMPSNSGKSRFTINLAAHLAFVHNKKVLIISNEMSEDKMKLCLTTTVINNPEIQKLHGQKIKISEGELLELKFRPNKGSKVKTDEDGYIAREEKETHEQYINKLKKNSDDFNKVLIVTDWLSEQVGTSIYFINITDHTDDELNKVINNYYYKEQIEYMFYDTLKADTENIGNGDAVKKTATILSNFAQNFGIYIGSTMQLFDNTTLPLNLDVNDLSASKTVKEVLDTLCLMKQIHRESLKEYEYSLNEVDTKFFDIEEFKDPNVRYYSCVVDKNRSGSKPKVLFRINLAYNSWEELGYLRLKQKKN